LESSAPVAVDATTSFGEGISGVGVYSRELLHGLATSGFAGRWEWFYRSQRYWRALTRPKPPNVTRRLLTDSWGNRGASLFHGLNQRLPRRRFRRQVVTFHDLFVLSGEYSTPDFRERFAAQAREAAAGADLIIAVSAFTAGQIEAYLKVPRERIRVVHHGVVQRAVVRRGLPDLPREKVVLCVGAIQRRKNQAALVRAFRAMPPDWTLVLAGSQGFEAENILGEIVSQVTARVRVTGYLSDDEIAAWYARASIFVFPSFDEGFGMPVLEAMAAGVPVIAGNCSALPEVCGGAALLVDPHSDEEIANAMLLLANDENCREQLLRKGSERAREFTWDKTISATVAVYREALG